MHAFPYTKFPGKKSVINDLNLSDVLCFLLQNVPTNIGSHQVKVQVKTCALSPVDFKVI